MASIFTRIVKGEIPSYKVAEDNDFYAFLDINPIVKGHTLVIPKREEDYIFDLEDGELSGLMLFAKKVAKSLKDNIECSRVAIVVLGMEVPHAHIHLLPITSENDENLHNALRLSDSEFKEIQDTVKL